MRSLRIALVSSDDPTDRQAFSGSLFSMTEALRRHAGEVTALGPLRLNPRMTTRLRAKASGLAGRGRYKYDHCSDLVARYGVAFTRRLDSGDFDLVFAPVASPQIAQIKTHLPIVYASDATFDLLLGLYPNFSNLSPASVREGHQVERAAIDRASLLLYPAQWPATSAVEVYGADPQRIRITPYGANLSPAPPPPSGRRLPQRLVLLFLAREWERKGGNLALATLRELHDRGVDAELVVCGCSPPAGSSMDQVRVIPFLDKTQADSRTHLSSLLSEATFLFVPTTADCFPIVFCEASAHGLPVITRDVGGVSEAVHHGVNGFVLPPTAGPDDYADAIQSAASDAGGYRLLVESSRAAYEQWLNWDAWGRDVADAMRGLLA